MLSDIPAASTSEFLDFKQGMCAIISCQKDAVAFLKQEMSGWTLNFTITVRNHILQKTQPGR